MNLLLLSILLATADPNATLQTQATLSYLQSLPSKQDHRVLSGQFIGYVGREDPNAFQHIYDATNQYPALMSTDYAEFDSSMNVLGANMYLVNQWYSGGLVEVSVHFNNPTNNRWNDAEVNWDDLLHTGTTTNTNLNTQLDRVVVGLAELQARGLVVLFRPLMEANGDWFWWGGRSRDEFVGLWDYVFKYMGTKGIHNLLWVYSVSAGYGDALRYYPGAEEVDVVGLDYYSADGWFEATDEYADLVGLGRPIALTEVGQCRASGFGCRPREAAFIIRSIKANMPLVVWFNAWDGRWALDRQLDLGELMNDGWIVNRGGVMK